MTTPNIEELIASLTQTNQFHESADICTADVIDVLKSQAERIKELESEVEMWKATANAVVDFEKVQLRAEIAAIAATEPVAYRWVWKSKPWDIEGWCYTNTPPTLPELQEIEPLFTRPMPAQDVTELVEALEMIVSTHQGHCEHHVGVSKHSYNLADIAEEALSKYKGAK